MTELRMGCDYPEGKVLSVAGETYPLNEDRDWFIHVAGTEFRMQYRAEHHVLTITQRDGGEMDPVELDAIAEVVAFRAG